MSADVCFSLCGPCDELETSPGCNPASHPKTDGKAPGIDNGWILVYNYIKNI